MTKEKKKDEGNKPPQKRMTALELAKRAAFRLGFLGAKKGIFEPEAFFTKRQDQIDYERGFHFHRVLKNKGIVLHSLPAKPTAELVHHIGMAAYNKEIL